MPTIAISPTSNTAEQPPSIYLLSAIAVQETTQGKRRRFSGIANSGQPFVYGGKRAIIDLSDIRHHPKLPALMLHDRSQRVGFGSLAVANHQLHVTGTLLDNEHGHAIANDADAGFPWQMSAHVTAERVDELTGNQTATINGQTVHAPMLILRGAHISEISFTPTGVDNNTSAVILSKQETAFMPTMSTASTNQATTLATAAAADASQTPNPTPNDVAKLIAEIAKLKAKISELEADNKSLVAEKAALTAAKEELETASHHSKVETLLSEHGFERDDDGNWQGLSERTVSVLLSADINDAKTMLADLVGQQQPTKTAPQWLLSETVSTASTNQQSVTSHRQHNALTRNAAERGKAQPYYI